MILAAIDIGSNAIRLQIVRAIDEDGYISFKKLEFMRFPLRLGKDVFKNGSISKPVIEKFTKLLQTFRLIIDLYEVDNFAAVATSAMREAKNGKDLCAKIKSQFDIDIQIIPGRKEAQILSKAIIPYIDEKPFVHIDVGGGSTELNVYLNRVLTKSKSFKVGSVRKLDSKKRKEAFDKIKVWIKKLGPALDGPVSAIGTGGNINKLFNLSNQKFNRSISLAEIRALRAYVKEYSYKERITKLKLNPDRADVILPASEIYLEVMEAAGAEQMFVPGTGLKDGLLYNLYEQVTKEDIKNIQFLSQF